MAFIHSRRYEQPIARWRERCNDKLIVNAAIFRSGRVRASVGGDGVIEVAALAVIIELHGSFVDDAFKMTVRTVIVARERGAIEVQIDVMPQSVMIESRTGTGDARAGLVVEEIVAGAAHPAAAVLPVAVDRGLGLAVFSENGEGNRTADFFLQARPTPLSSA